MSDVRIGTLMRLRAFRLKSLHGNDTVLWFASFRDMKPSGFLAHGTPVIVAEPGEFFHQCMCAAGKVYFKVENLELVP